MGAKEKSIEELMDELNEIVVQLESPDIKLDDAIRQNEEALKLIRICRTRLDSARQKISKLVQVSDDKWESIDAD